MGLTVTVLAKNAEPMDLIENIGYGRWESICTYVHANYVPAADLLSTVTALNALDSTGYDPVVWDARTARLVGHLFLSAVPRDLPYSSDPVRGTVRWLANNFASLGEDCAVEIG